MNSNSPRDGGKPHHVTAFGITPHTLYTGHQMERRLSPNAYAASPRDGSTEREHLVFSGEERIADEKLAAVSRDLAAGGTLLSCW